MKTIYIGFSRPIKFSIFAWLIQKIESRSYDHVYIRFNEPTGDELIFQASKEMVNLYNTKIFHEINLSIKEYEINCTDEQYDLLWAFIKANLGVPYSLSEDFGILLMKVFKLKKQPFDKGMSAQFCSKLGAIVCEMFGIEVSDDLSAVDPSKLDYVLSRSTLKMIEFQ